MFDYERFDQWVAAHDTDEEAFELAQVVIEHMVLADALLGPAVADAIGREVARIGLGSYPDPYAEEETQAHFQLGDPVSAVEVIFTEVDFLEFQFAQKANGLKCYAMTGMIESEDPAAFFDQKQSHLSDLIEWGRLICEMIPEDKKALPKFRSIWAAAEARFSIDMGHAVDTVAFSHLAAIFREGTPDQVRKTLQNQISAKQLEVNERRELLPSSALQFLRGIQGFPSIWMLQEQPALDVEQVSDPIFVPVCPATFSSSEKPFLPSERHDDGYRVGAGAGSVTFDSYWKALQWLSQSPEPAFLPVGHEVPIRCKQEWLRVDKRLVENEMSAVSKTSPKSLTDQIHQRLGLNPKVRTHPVGHAAKAYRYRLDNGTELALEKRIGEPWLYLRQDILPEVAGVDYTDVVGTNDGRTSTLNALPSFVNEPLRKFKLKSVADLEAVMTAMDDN